MEDKKRHVQEILVLCTVACILLGVSIVGFWRIKDSGQAEKMVLYSTDLSIDGDFDDYFDLVVMKSLDGIDLKIIVDGTDSAQKQSGADAIRNLEKIEGGGYSGLADVVIGRDNNLKFLYDADVDDRLVKLLEGAKGKIDVVTVGSLRDVAALYNHCPDLFENKVEKVWVFAGDAEGTMTEYNVSLDETAFLRIMNSGKRAIHWIPCFQNGIWTRGENASYFTMEHSEVFRDADPGLLLWFLYRYEKSGEDFQGYILQKHDTGAFMKEMRNMWCAPLFLLIDGSMEQYWDRYCEKKGQKNRFPFGFVEKKVCFSDGGKVEWGSGNMVHVFEIYDYDEYVALSKFILEDIFRNF